MASEYLKRMAAQERLQTLDTPAATAKVSAEGAAESRPQPQQPSAFLLQMAAQEQAQKAVQTAPATTPPATTQTAPQPSAFLLQMVEREKQRNAEMEALKKSVGYDDKIAQSGMQKYLLDKETLQTKAAGKTIWQQLLENNAKAYTAATDSVFGTTMNQVVQQYRDDTSYKEPSDKWSTDQKNVFSFLYARSPAEASAYAISVNNAINKAETDAIKEEIRGKATDNPVAGALHTGGALLTAPTGLADFFDNLAEFNASF